RGPAPVTYGATSFVGVIHVVHKSSAAKQTYATAHIGNFGTVGGAVDLALPGMGGWESRLTIDGERQGFSDDRTSFGRVHALWRAGRAAGNRKTWAHVGFNRLDQGPARPPPPIGTTPTAVPTLRAHPHPPAAFS